MILLAFILHLVTVAVFLSLIHVLADWACSADTPGKRQQRGVKVIVLLVPFEIMALYANAAPWLSMASSQ